jgi:ABC-2 type transport system ATP-binding protein
MNGEIMNYEKENIIVVEGLEKSFGKTEVLKGVSLNVKRGAIHALLGPNGAGKTTIVRILSTLLSYDSGTVDVNGCDAVKDADNLRKLIGLTGQSTAVDELLTGRENLIMIGRLYHLAINCVKDRAQELLEQFDLLGAADRQTKTYSGGMRRRLDLAASLVAMPPVIFLDEPTTGLDPRSRLTMWSIINDLKKMGTTILLTTQYLEEADQLADQITVIDNGVVIAEGTPIELKSKVGKDRLEITLGTTEALHTAEKLLKERNVMINDENLSLNIIIEEVGKDVQEVLDLLSRSKIEVASLNVHTPTLDDVFLSLTGKQKSISSETEEK